MAQVKLESFESDSLLAEKPDEGFAQGFTEGHAAGLVAAQAAQATLTQEMVQSVADLQFKYEEARGEITQAMGPLLTTLAYKIFPQYIADGFADQIVTLLLDAATNDAAGQFTLRIHPDNHEAVSAAIASAPLDANVVADEAVQLNAAWIQYEAGTLHIDCDQLLADIKAIISSIDLIQPRSETHG
ncbi:FliH/SctL family protein [Roseobacter sp. CCS2]|uniref:FliH/SctL family protein n=1 Tax=Roseobacter sp. CCS2 TaxID=391593 RepID=UPI0000F40424|nr:hypothetical protein [Roseobacter sp. CCS2]EBA13851.1 hypothetical protein RCCS2_08179 [Roseobacter sp. CCS2]